MFKRITALLLALMCIAYAVCAAAEPEAHDSAPTGAASASLFYSDSYTEDAADSLVHYMTVDYFVVQSSSAGKVKVTIKVTTEQTMEKLGFSALTIQHWTGSTWEDVAAVNDQYSLNSTLFTYMVIVSNLTGGDYYRAKVDLVARKTWLLVEHKSLTSSYIVCQ